VNQTYIKLFIGLVLFGTLVTLTVLQVPHAERLIDLIYMALMGLGITHLNTPPGPPGAPVTADPFRGLPTQPQGE
jgi:hydrogenase/urease accessory protein HupE